MSENYGKCMGKLLKSDYTKIMQNRLGMSKKEVEQILKVQEEILLDAVKGGKKVIFSGFGTFEMRYYKGRTKKKGLDLQEPTRGKPHVHLKFKMSNALEKHLCSEEN